MPALYIGDQTNGLGLTGYGRSKKEKTLSVEEEDLDELPVLPAFSKHSNEWQSPIEILPKEY